MPEKYFQNDSVTTYVVDDPYSEPEIADEIYRFRGDIYQPHEEGEWSYIADTDITLVGPDLESPSTDYAELREFHPIFDRQRVPGHKLGKTAYFFVRDNETDDIHVSGWIVPYSPITGIPMENRCGEHGYDWSNYMAGNDPYLIESGIGSIDAEDSVEIGRLCSTKKARMTSVLLAFKTLHKFLEELGVDNYFDAAMDIPGRGLASLYESVGMRKVEQYDCDTVTGSKKENGIITPVLTPITYWAQHMNVPHTKERGVKNDFGKSSENGAFLREKLMKIIVPGIFEKQPSQSA